MKKSKTKKIKLTILILILVITIGYAILRTGLNINGTANIGSVSWDIYFDNLQATANSNVTPTDVSNPTSQNKLTTISYTVNLTVPGDTYEFTVDAVNNGSIDAMIESISSKLNNVEINNNLPAYLDYSVTYSDGITPIPNHLLAHNTHETYKVKVGYKTDVNPSDLPTENQELHLNLTITYVQADENAVPVRVEDADFTTDSWDNIIAASKAANPTTLEQQMSSGTTRAVPLDLNQDGENDAICNLRIANLSTPAECYEEGFSQTACGLVLECANVITTHVMNPTYDNGNIGTGNVGGWPASEMRTFLNDEIANVESVYNALPTDLRSKIIPTYVVSGHGHQSGAINYTSTDKIYLLSAKEAGWNDTRYDTANAATRILDYYTTNGMMQNRMKKNQSSTYSSWWLRTAYPNDSTIFLYITNSGNTGANCGSDGSLGISPAFRIGTPN